MPEHHCAQNADYLAPNTLFSRFFAEVVCDLGATPPQTVTPLPPNGGIYAIQGSDTPTSHRQSASHGAKPPTLTPSDGPASPIAVPMDDWARPRCPRVAAVTVWESPQRLQNPPQGPQGPADRSRNPQGWSQHPPQTNFAGNSPTARISARSKTVEYQRSEDRIRNMLTGIACEIAVDHETPQPYGATSPLPIRGNCTTRGSDTPMTRRQKASCSETPRRFPRQ